MCIQFYLTNCKQEKVLMRAIIFTDLDASLLHEETFSCFEIIDTLKSFMSNGVLIVPNTSKTEIETRNVLESLGISQKTNAALPLSAQEYECVGYEA